VLYIITETVSTTSKRH